MTRDFVGYGETPLARRGTGRDQLRPHCNDYKFVLAGGFPDGQSFEGYMRDTYEQLYGGRRDAALMTSARTPGSSAVRARGLGRFLDEVAGRPDVWIATRGDIARHWAATHPPGG